MKYGSADLAFFLLDGLNLLGDESDLTDKIEDLMQDSQPFGAVWNAVSPTSTKRAELSQDGWFNDATGRVHEVIGKNRGVRRVVAFGIETNTAGKAFIGMEGAYASSYTVAMQRNQLQKASAQYQIDGAVERPVVLHALGAESGDGNSEAASVDQADNPMVNPVAITSSSVANPTHIITPVAHGLITNDVILIAGHTGSTPTINGERIVTKINDTEFTIPVNVTIGGTGGTLVKAWTKNGGAGHLHVTAITLSGRPNVVFKVRHSADDVVFADLLTFTAIAAVGAERKTVAAGTTVNRHLAYSRTWGGAGGSPAATFVLGFARA